MKRDRMIVLAFFVCCISQSAFAAEGGAKFVSYFGLILDAFGVSGHSAEDWKPVLGAGLTLVLTTILGLIYRRRTLESANDLAPKAHVGVLSIVDVVAEFVVDLVRNTIGEAHYKRFLTFLVGLFSFIFVSNLSGLVPGITPSTDSINTNLVLGLAVFFVFNLAGFREHGFWGYLKTFAGPIVWMMPFLFIIEAIGMMARPLSLSLRLYGNIFGDHLVLSVFTGLTKLVLPSFLLFFGLLVACLQSFVFTLLSSIYISLSVSHDH